MDKESTKPNNGKIVQSNNLGVSLAEAIYRFRLRYRAEMADLELADWLETLRLYPLKEVIEAMNDLMHNPPKQVLPDGTMQKWTGFPRLTDVTQAIEESRQYRVADWRQKETQRMIAETRELEKQREANPEKFFGWADLMKEFGERLLRKP